MSVSESPNDQVMVKEDDRVPESPQSAVGNEESKGNLQNKGIQNKIWNINCKLFADERSPWGLVSGRYPSF